MEPDLLGLFGQKGFVFRYGYWVCMVCYGMVWYLSGWDRIGFASFGCFLVYIFSLVVLAFWFGLVIGAVSCLLSGLLAGYYFSYILLGLLCVVCLCRVYTLLLNGTEISLSLSYH
ncbi:hypothetical protein V8F33_003950 [Rhypophila sp. PSN 637]